MLENGDTYSFEARLDVRSVVHDSKFFKAVNRRQEIHDLRFLGDLKRKIQLL
jgi:hypothetical protein